jgi:hypothetical protein
MQSKGKMKKMEIEAPASGRAKRQRSTSIQELPVYVPLDYHVTVRQPSRQVQQQTQYKQFICVCLGLGVLVLLFGAPLQILRSLATTKHIDKAGAEAWSLHWGGSVFHWGDASNITAVTAGNYSENDVTDDAQYFTIYDRTDGDYDEAENADDTDER